VPFCFPYIYLAKLLFRLASGIHFSEYITVDGPIAANIQFGSLLPGHSGLVLPSSDHSFSRHDLFVPIHVDFIAR
jgi:hypothetical protein